MLDLRYAHPQAIVFLEVLILAFALAAQRLGIRDPDSRRRRLRISIVGTIPFLLATPVLSVGLRQLFRHAGLTPPAGGEHEIAAVAAGGGLLLPLISIAALVHFRSRPTPRPGSTMHILLWCAVAVPFVPRPTFLLPGAKILVTGLAEALWLASFLLPFAVSLFLCHTRLGPLLAERAAVSRLDALGPGFLALVAMALAGFAVSSAARASFRSNLDLASATLLALRSHERIVRVHPPDSTTLSLEEALDRLRRVTRVDLWMDAVLWEAALAEARGSRSLVVRGGEIDFLGRAIAAENPTLSQHALVFLRSSIPGARLGSGTRSEAFSRLEPALRRVLESSPDAGLRFDAAAVLLRTFDVREPEILRQVLEVGVPARDSLVAVAGLRTTEARRACIVDDLVYAGLSLNRGSVSSVRDLVVSTGTRKGIDVSFAVRMLSDEVLRCAKAGSRPPDGPILALASLGSEGRSTLRRCLLDYGPPKTGGEEDPFFLALLDAVVRPAGADTDATSDALSRSLAALARTWPPRLPQRPEPNSSVVSNDPNLARLLRDIASGAGPRAFPSIASAFVLYAPRTEGDSNWLRMADALRALDPKAARPTLERALLENPPLSANDSTYRSLAGYCLVAPWETAAPLGRKILARYRYMGDPDENYRQIISTLVGLGGADSIPALIEELLRERVRGPGLPPLQDPCADPNREIVRRALTALGPKVSGPAITRVLSQGGSPARTSACEADLVEVAKSLGLDSAVGPILKRMQAMSANDIRGRLGRLYSAFANAVGEMGGPGDKAAILKERERVRGFSPQAREAERDLEMAAAQLISRNIIGPETTLVTLKSFRPSGQSESGGRYADMLARAIRDAGPKSAYPVLLEELGKFKSVKNEDYGALVEAIGRLGGMGAEEVLMGELAAFRARPSLAEEDENVPGYRSLVRALALLPGGGPGGAKVDEALLTELDRNEIPRPEFYDCVRSALQEAGKTGLLARRSHSVLAAIDKGMMREDPAHRFVLLKNAAMEGEWEALRPLLAILMTTAPAGPDDPIYIRMVDELKEIRFAGPRGEGPGPEGSQLMASTLEGEREKFKQTMGKGEAFLHLFSSLMVFEGVEKMKDLLETELALPGQPADVRDGLQALKESLGEDQRSAEEGNGGGSGR